MKKKQFIILLGVLFSFGISLIASDKIDVMALKKKEDARRKKIQKSKYEINDANLTIDRSGGKAYSIIKLESNNSAATAKNDTKVDNKDAKKEGNPAKQEEEWRREKSEIENRLNETRQALIDNNDRLNQLRRALYITDDINRQMEMKNQISEMEKLSAKLEEDTRTAEKALDDFFARARLEGIPPGWLR